MERMKERCIVKKIVAVILMMISISLCFMKNSSYSDELIENSDEMDLPSFQWRTMKQ